MNLEMILNKKITLSTRFDVQTIFLDFDDAIVFEYAFHENPGAESYWNWRTITTAFRYRSAIYKSSGKWHHSE